MDVIRRMMHRAWKWRWIGALLAFQLDPYADTGCWEIVDELSRDERDFVRRLVADQVASFVARDAGRVLSILTRLVGDPNRFVREAAHRATMRLPAPVALDAAIMLATAKDRLSLAAEVVLWPLDVESPLLADKLKRLARPGTDPRLWMAVFNYLRTLADPLWNGLLLLEWWEELQPNNDIAAALTVKAEQLETTVGWMRELCRAIDQALDVLKHNGIALDLDPRQALSTPFESLLPMPHRERVLAAIPVRPATVKYTRLDRWSLMTWIRGGVGPYPSRSNVQDAELIELWLLRRELGSQSAEYPPDVLLNRYAPRCGDRERRALNSVDRLALWLWEAQNKERRRESSLDALVTEYRALSEKELHARLDRYEQYPLPEAVHSELQKDLLAVCRATEENPALLARVTAPLLAWHENRDTPVADQQLETLRQRYPDSFWRLAQALLAHHDQVIVDVVSRVVELAEATDPEAEEVLSAIANMLNEIAGIDPTDVRLDLDIVNELDVDSLSAVELAVQAEDYFVISVPDDVFPQLRTIRDTVNYVLEHRRRGM